MPADLPQIDEKHPSPKTIDYDKNDGSVTIDRTSMPLNSLLF
jgi:hypothetical protein